MVDKDPAFRTERHGDGRIVFLSGVLDAESVSDSWNEATAIHDSPLKVDASKVETCDGAGLALLHLLTSRKGAELIGLKPEIQRLLAPFQDGKSEASPSPKYPRRMGPIENLGKLASEFFEDLAEIVAFLGKTVATFLECCRKPSLIRWTDLWVVAERAGVNALLIVGLISFLTGMILAFQAATALSQFGVEIFVVNLVSLAMLREMGVIMTGVVLAGRSGSAFAAEIGTMKINEEVSALETMGLDPVRFLVMPRVLAGILIMPFLTIYADMMGVAGGFLVMRLEGYPLPALWNQLVGAVGVNDLLSGLIKSFFFGFLVAGIGCLRGLQTRSGPSAVGESTTRSVVSGIFLIVVADAIFAVVFYVLKF
jgi:phospholipid/cholesterol/gamma-HCH transport system permease protein